MADSSIENKEHTLKLELDRLSPVGTPTQAILSHEGVRINWNVALNDKMSYSGNFDIFEQINGYWAHLPKQTQDQIFAVYKRIDETFQTVWDVSDLTERLYELVHELYVYHDLKDIKHWLTYHSTVIIPSNLRETYHESHEQPGTRERTYLRPDYEWLVALSIALRPMIPVWGEFISRARRETGTTYKEYYAYRLLVKSSIYASEPMERLRVYVEQAVPADKSKSAAILEGLSSDDFPIWVLGLVLVRRLSIGDVRGVEQDSNLITFIYKYIGQKVKGHDQSFIGLVKDKIVEGVGQEGENNLSKLEGYKIKQDIPAGDVAPIAYYMENPEQVARRVCEDIDLNLLRDALASVQVLQTKQIWHPQMVLMQWVLSQVIPSRGLLHLSKPLTLRALGVTQALLWHRGHYELAALVSATEQDNIEAQQLPGTESRARISKEQMEMLDALYPYSKRAPGKQKGLKRINPAAESIDSLSASFSEHAWRLTLPADCVALVTGNKNNRRYAVPHDIKIKLAALAISIQQRKF